MYKFKKLKYSKKHKKSNYSKKPQNGGQPVESSIAQLDSDIAKNQTHGSNYTITHEDPEWPLNFSVKFESDSLSQHINKLTKMFLSGFPLTYNLDNCRYDGNIVLEIINNSMFAEIAERNKFFIIKTESYQDLEPGLEKEKNSPTIQQSSKPIKIVELTSEQLRSLTDPLEIESACFIRIVAHTFHYLNRETMSKNVTLNGNKIIDSDDISTINMSETINRYTAFISALSNKLCRIITAKEILYMLILFNAGDEKTTIFFNNFNYTTEDELSRSGLILNNRNATLSITDTSNEYSNPNIFLKRYERDIENLLSLPNSTTPNNLFQQIQESNSYFVKVSTFNDETTHAVKCEIIIKKYAVFFLYITLPTSDRMHKRKILGITLVEETSNLRRNTYDYGLKFIWTLNDVTKKLLMDSYDIQDAITYFPDIRVLHSGVKKSLHSIVGDRVSKLTPMRSVTTAAQSLRNMFSRKNREPNQSEEENYDATIKTSATDETFVIDPHGKGGRKSKKIKKNKKSKKHITKKHKNNGSSNNI
jgi:hypothetical protein